MNDDKFCVIDATDIIVLGGYGNKEGNLDLLKIERDELNELIRANNDENDNIRLINSLLDTIKEQQEILDKIKEDNYE